MTHARGKDAFALLRDENTNLYLCGLKRMETRVDASFHDICTAEDADWNMLRGELLQQGRYHVKTY